MPDYQNGKIYKLWSPQGEEIYFGSTTNSLTRRFNNHKCMNERCSSKYLFEKYDDVRIELVEEYPCNNRIELYRKEGEYIKNNSCINKTNYNKSREEISKDYYEKNKDKYHDHYEKNKDYKLNYQNEYREKNIEKIKERKSIRIICECGLEVNKDGIARHKKSNRHISNLK